MMKVCCCLMDVSRRTFHDDEVLAACSFDFLLVSLLIEEAAEAAK